MPCPSTFKKTEQEVYFKKVFIGKKNIEADTVRMYLEALVVSRRKEVVKKYDVQPLYDWLNDFTNERKQILKASNDFVSNKLVPESFHSHLLFFF